MTTTTTAPATTQHTSLLTGFDILDIYCALQNAAANDCTSLDKRDRQALALLTYTPLRGITRMLITKLADGRATLPLTPALATHLLEVAADVAASPVTVEEENAWLASRDVETPCVVDQIIGAVAGYTAARHGELGQQLLDGALQTIIRVGKPGMPLSEVPRAARHAVAEALAGLALDGLLPTPASDPIETLAAYCDLYEMDIAGAAMRSSLLATLLTRDHNLPAAAAVQLTREGYDDRVRAAGREADRLIQQARHARLAADYDEETAVAL
ncbi:hypothetical protein [Nonomuraea sp. NPDC049646]|uniref:hypothetical protein n=1 Tax=unclassified Nonomuraea TaxID=2593643 RepID=UPI00379D58C8